MMKKKTLFRDNFIFGKNSKINIYEKYNFLNDTEIQKIINSINPEDLGQYDYFKGNHKTTYVSLANGAYILDLHKDIEDKIMNEVVIKDQRMQDSWVNIQGEGSTLKYHNHPGSVISGVIVLKADEHSSKLVFKNPYSKPPKIETEEITLTTGLLLMWPSILMHGSGDSVNQSKDRAVLSFNTWPTAKAFNAWAKK